MHFPQILVINFRLILDEKVDLFMAAHYFHYPLRRDPVELKHDVEGQKKRAEKILSFIETSLKAHSTKEE